MKQLTIVESLPWQVGAVFGTQRTNNVLVSGDHNVLDHQFYILLYPLDFWQEKKNLLLIFTVTLSAMHKKQTCWITKYMQGHALSHTHTHLNTKWDSTLQTQTTTGFSELLHSSWKSILHLLSPIIRSHVDNPTIHLSFQRVGEKEKQGGWQLWGVKQHLGVVDKKSLRERVTKRQKNNCDRASLSKYLHKLLKESYIMSLYVYVCSVQHILMHSIFDIFMMTSYLYSHYNRM